MKKTIILIAVLLCPEPVLAGLFDDLVDKAKQAVEEKVYESVDPHSNGTENKQTDNNTVAAAGNSMYIKIEDIPAGRRPATYKTLAVTRLRYDPDWLTGDDLLKATQLSIDCQQYAAGKGFVRGSGCMGELIGQTHTGYIVKIAPLFTDEEIAGRNPAFAAKEYQDRMKPALLKLAQHLSTEFGDTVGWRGTYDFNQGVLNIDIRGYEQAPRNITNRLPKNVLHLDLRNPNRANFDGTQGEYYKLKAWMPGIPGIYALAFDRDLGHGRIAMSASEAEQLFKDSSKNYVAGTAVVEFNVNDTAGEAALATLEQVRLLSAGEKIDLDSVKPFMTIPASAFPVREAPAHVVEKSKQAPAPVVKQPLKESQSTMTPDPYLRVKQGKAYGPDIVGLQLGMTLDEADQLIRNHKQPIKVITGKVPPPFTGARGYVLAPGDEAISLFTLDSPAGERIAAYVRIVHFNPDSAPSQTAVASSVEKKYGTPFYAYDAKESHFDRNWLTNWKGEAVSQGDANAQQVGKCERAASARTTQDVWLDDDGKPYHWYLPWLQERAAGSLWALKPGDPERIEKINRCGPTLIAKYATNSGDLIGPTLTTLLFDGAWIMDAVTKHNTDETIRGAKGLDL